MTGTRGQAPQFLLDTHIWYWYLAGSDRLPVGLRKLIDSHSEGLWLSPISVWEVGMLNKHGRIRLQGGMHDWLADALERFPLREAPLNREVALKSLEVELPHRDPADHFLASTALVYDLTLMTVDARLSSARWLPTRSR